MVTAVFYGQVRTRIARLVAVGRTLLSGEADKSVCPTAASVIIAGVFLLWTPPVLVAIEPEPASSHGLPPTPKDNQFTLYARQALAQDEQLAPWNLGVTVRAGVANVWGTAPNLATARRAVERVRQVPGLIEVRNEIRIVAAEEMIEDGGSSNDRGSKVVDRGSRIEDRGPKTEDRGSKMEAGPPLCRVGSSTFDPRSFQSNTATASYRNAPSNPPALMPPIPVPVGQSAVHQVRREGEAGAPAYPAEPGQTLLFASPDKSVRPTASPSRSGRLAEMVLQVRQGDVSYRLIQFEIRGGTIRLWSPRNQGESLFAMAQSVSRLPGVERVIVENQFSKKGSGIDD
jgi:hypothetical protein